MNIYSKWQDSQLSDYEDDKTEINGREDPLHWTYDIFLPENFGMNFADKLLLLGRYSSLATERPQTK
jgi:hypothetical protein